MIVLALAVATLLILGAPVMVALGLGGAAGLLALDGELLTVPTRMFTGIDSFVLLAAPFYILAGEMMARGGVTDRLVLLSRLLVGRVRGGSAYSNILGSVFFSGVSGTAIADTAALGQVFIRSMPREGYSVAFAAAVTVASSVIGPIIPPSVIMVLYAAVARVSVIELFLAGVVPGLLLAGACAVVVFLAGRRGGLPRASVSVARAEVPVLVRDALLLAGLPLIIILGTLGGAFTATEGGGVAVLYAALLGRLVFGRLDGSGAWNALRDAARTTSALFLIVAAATVTSYALTIGGLGAAARGLPELFGHDRTLFMLGVMGLLLLVGCVLDPGAAAVLLTPFLMPAARALGIDELQFSMVVLLSLTLGVITPPVGVCLFVACRIGELPLFRLVRAVLPFLLAEIVVVIGLILVPEFSTALPRWLRGA